MDPDQYRLRQIRTAYCSAKSVLFAPYRYRCARFVPGVTWHGIQRRVGAQQASAEHDSGAHLQKFHEDFGPGASVGGRNRHPRFHGILVPQSLVGTVDVVARA